MTSLPSRSEWLKWLGEPDERNASGAKWELRGPKVRSLRTRSADVELCSKWVLPSVAEHMGIVVVPYYETGTIFGERATRRGGKRLGGARFARHFLRRGFSVVGVPWWAESEAIRRNTDEQTLEGRYGSTNFSACSGLGRAVSDTSNVISCIRSVEPSLPIHLLGHSLGGKIALWTAALDERVASLVCHELGLGWKNSNWNAAWYVGTRVPLAEMDSVLALVAPRPALYAGGGGFDGAWNLPIATRAGEISGVSGWISTLHHNSGHALPEHVTVAFASWLETAGKADSATSLRF